MTEYSFKSGIVVRIPDSIPDQDKLDEWTNAKMLISVLLHRSPAAIEPKTRKPYTFSDAEMKKILAGEAKAKTKKRGDD